MVAVGGVRKLGDVSAAGMTCLILSTHHTNRGKCELGGRRGCQGMGGGEEGETNALLTFTAGRKSFHVSPQRCSKTKCPFR